MTHEIIARESLREVIASDAYAATFQTLKQYRQALLKHIDNRAEAERLAEAKKVAGTST